MTDTIYSRPGGDDDLRKNRLTAVLDSAPEGLVGTLTIQI